MSAGQRSDKYTMLSFCFCIDMFEDTPVTEETLFHNEGVLFELISVYTCIFLL